MIRFIALGTVLAVLLADGVDWFVWYLKRVTIACVREEDQAIFIAFMGLLMWMGASDASPLSGERSLHFHSERLEGGQRQLLKR